MSFFSAGRQDWLQGPYVYALYDSYGFDSEDIAILFIMGFCASMVVGTFVGALSDKYGRRNMCIAFSVSYFIAALTKLSTDFYTLLIGRFLSGVATSLLFSTFEAWMVSEHHNRGFAAALLEETFALATLGNGVVAVGAGLVAGQAADMYGFVAPFVVCLVPLAAAGIIVAASWAENYGDQKVEIVATFTNAWAVVKADKRILYLGAAQSAFEGAMYTFVFMWTPALATSETKDTLPYGTIFAVFMVCSMAGSSIFSLLLSKLSVEQLPHYIFAPAAAGMFATAFFLESKALVYVAFLVFEVTVGMFYPTFGARWPGLPCLFGNTMARRWRRALTLRPSSSPRQARSAPFTCPRQRARRS